MDSIPNIFEDYDKLSPSEGEIVYLFRFNGKKAQFYEKVPCKVY